MFRASHKSIKQTIFTSSILPGQEVGYAEYTEICDFLEEKQEKDAGNAETGLWQSVQPNFPWKQTLSKYCSKLESSNIV